MFTEFSRTVLATALLLNVGAFSWAAEEKPQPPAKAEKMKETQKKPAMRKMMKGTEEHRKLQEALKAKGNDPGPVDGMMGPRTRAALKAFQEANGLKATGQLDDQTAEKLGIEKMGKETKAMKKETEPTSKEKK